MGLEQEFNSLDAQRESCEAYVRSQASVGWTAVPERYDDGGFTGANIDRPAFQRLLADVEAGKVDVVVVYKLDRVSRSLLDFATVMKRLNEAGVSFVSVTQNFSTTDAVGRMTLNLLATFAEFEREQIGERTRDKMAASRRRGKWTGGSVPLGYRVVDKKLVVDELEAVLVREVFGIYLEQRSALATVRLLNERGRATKRHLAISGRQREARPWAKANVLRLLKNPVYAGFMPYGEELHEGEHTAIVDRETFEAAKLLLASAGGGKGPRFRNPDYLLGGILFCARCGSALTAASTRKGNREYRYYRCVKRDQQGRAACPTKPLSAPAIEDFVADRLREAIAESDLVADLNASIAVCVEARRRDLLVERRRLPGEIASLSAEGRRLVEKIGNVAGGAQHLLDGRLEEVGAQLQRLERRLTDVERELAALDATEVEAGWIGQCLRDFEAVWDVLTGENRCRLFRAIVERVDYEGTSGEVRVTLADLTSAAPEALLA
jgi:DNA invertase Pin-like site-specific DNA recombinase